MIGPMWKRLVLCLCLALLSSAAASAATREKLTLREAVARVQQQTQGRILAAQTVGRGARQVYRIKVLTPDGRVRVVQVPVQPDS